MHLQGLLFLPLALPIVHAGFKATRPSCRCFPGEPCWPTVQQWSDFNATLGGKLISTVPIGSVCHTSGAFAAYDAQGCADLLDNWAYPTTHYESSSSPMASWFANFSCDPFLPHRSCEIGSLQPYAVNVSGPEDVQATLRFTRKHNIRLVIRNTGHDYLGKSTAPGAVALWMHNLKDTQHLQYTSPSYNGSALRLGAGIQGYEAMAAAHAHNKVVVSGNCESVGVAGGYSQAGGHGQLASQFGLGADQVLEWEVVTADGKLRRASPTENSDLHWAITGGGGGTYAVVLSATVKAHAELITSSANLTFSGTDVDPAVFWEVVQTFIVDIQPLVDAGAVAIWAVAGSSFMLTPIAFPGGSLQQLQAGLASTLALLDQHNITYTYHIEQFDTFWDSYAAMNPHSNITEAQIGGRLMPRSVIDSKIPALISVLQGIADEGVVISGVSLNVSRAATPRNAVNPVWRDAAISFVLGTTYNYTSRAVDIHGQSLMTDVLIPQLTTLSPDSGAYLNEADWKQPNWKSAFYGENYAALEAVKKKYDPHHIFYARTAVGSDKWTETNDGHLCISR